MTQDDSREGEIDDKTVIMDPEVLTRLLAESRHPPPLPRSEQQTVRLPRPPRMPQG